MPEDNHFINKFPHYIDRRFVLAVEMGKVPGAIIQSQFAESPSISAAVPEDIWDFPSEPLYTFSTTAAIDSMSGDDDSDTVLMVIIGLDANFNRVTQTKALTGQTKVTLDTPLIRVNNVFNGNGIDLAGNVYVYEDTAIVAGIPSDTTKVRAYVSQAEQKTLMAVVTIPAGETGFFLGLTSSISRQPVAANCVYTGRARAFGGVFITQLRYNMSTTGTSYIATPPTSNISFSEKTDLVAHAEVSANGVGVSTTLDILCLENERFGLG